MVDAYKEFKKDDVELYNISLNAKKYGIDFGSNINILEMLFSKKDININKADLEKIAEIFSVLEWVKESSQLSR